jgi:hypothetical protein
MGRKWGGQLRANGDGSYHATLWRADENGGKGERLSWEQHHDGRIADAHYTDQDRRSHTSEPEEWRGGSFLWLLLLLGGIAYMICQIVQTI